MSLLDDCQRYTPDDEEMRALFEAERDVNQEEGSSLKILAAAYVRGYLLPLFCIDMSFI